MIILLSKSAPAHIEGLIAVVFGTFFLLWMLSVTIRWLRRKPWKSHAAEKTDAVADDPHGSSPADPLHDKDLQLTTPGHV